MDKSIKVKFHDAEKTKIRSFDEYVGSKFHDVRKGWHENGQLEYEWSYQNGKKHGISKGWRENGQLQYKHSYQNGELHDVCKSWYNNGQLQYEHPYQNGKEHGVWKGWYESGQLQYEYSYQNGKRHSVRRWWYENGQLSYQAQYQNGKEHGIDKGWHENGQLRYENYRLYGNLVTEEEYRKRTWNLEFADTVKEPCEVFVVLHWHWDGNSWLDDTYVDCFLDQGAAVQCANGKAGIMAHNNAAGCKLKEFEFSGKVFMPGEDIPTSGDGNNRILGFYQIIRKEF